MTNAVAILTWQATAGAIYELQSKDSLTASNWTACGNPLIASVNTASLTNSIAGAPGRFYCTVMVN